MHRRPELALALLPAASVCPAIELVGSDAASRDLMVDVVRVAHTAIS